MKRPASPNPDRRHVKHSDIAKSLRARIVRGGLKPGQKLPTRVELEKASGATVVTVQRALDLLTREGFVYSSGRRGTFVSEHPPHLDRFVLAFNNHPAKETRHWSQFYAALQDAATHISQSGSRTVVPVFDINGLFELENYRSLVDDAKARRIAGVIFAFPPFGMEDSELLTMEPLARVGLMSRPRMNIPCVTHDVPEFFRRAANCLRDQGCRRVAVLSTGTPDLFLSGKMESMFRAAKLEFRPRWMQCPVFTDPIAVRNCLDLLLCGRPKDRPDGLIVGDDHLVGPATQALAEHPSIRVPKDLKVVGMGNFPWPPNHYVPTTLLGFNVRDALRTAMSLIDSINQGKAVPQVTLLPPAVG